MLSPVLGANAINITLADLILLASCGIAAWIVYYLFSKTRSKTCNAYLGMLVLVGFLYMFVNIIHHRQLYRTNPALLFLPIYWSWGFGPFLFLYFKYLLHDKALLDRHELIHLIPWLSQVLFQVYWYAQPFDEKLNFYQDLYIGPVRFYEQLIGMVLGLIYATFSYLHIRKYFGKNENSVDKESRAVLIWAKNLSFLFIMFLLVWLFYSFLLISAPKLELPPVAYYPFFLIIILLTGYVAHNVYKYPTIVSGHITFILSSRRDQLFESKLEELTAPRIFDLEAGPYPLEEIAQLLKVDSNFLSTYLKIHYGTNYPGFVRHCRMKKFSQLVEEANSKDEEVLVSNLQKLCGYRNRGSFNRDVKETYGHSPSEYLKMIAPSS